MSRRDYPANDPYDDRQSDVYRRPRTERNFDESDVDIRQSRYDGPAPSRYDAPAPSRRADTAVKERERDETVVSRRTDRGPRQPDFLREDYGRSSNSGPLVVREERREEDDYVSRAPTRRRSLESVRSPRTERVEKDEVIFRERERDRGGPPYPRSERGSFTEKDEVTYRDRTRSRPPPNQSEEKIDIRIRDDETSGWRPPPRSEYKERDVEEIRFRRGGGDRAPPPARTEVDKEEITFTREERSRPPPARTEIDREEIRIRETRSPPPQEPYRGREGRREKIDIDIREERSAPPPRQRSMSRGALVRKDREEWIVRRRRTPTPSPPPRDYEREEIIIRRKERTPSPEPIPEPPREPTPEPLPPPPEPIYRPPIIQEVITHHRHIDHGVERVRSPSPPPPPAPPSPPREDNLEIEIRRKGTRNGKAYDEDIIFEQNTTERKDQELSRQVSRRRSVSASTRRRSPSATPSRRTRYQDDVAAEADYYNRKVSSRAYPGEAYNGATKDWGLVDIPPGTERVAMDGVGGGRQEITWERYNGERRGKFGTGDRLYEGEYGNGIPAPGPPPASLPPPERSRDQVTETRITERRITEETSRGKTKDRMWTEVTKDLVTKEAIEEMGYEYEETDEFFYVIEYLRYVSCLSPARYSFSSR